MSDIYLQVENETQFHILHTLIGNEIKNGADAMVNTEYGSQLYLNMSEYVDNLLDIMVMLEKIKTENNF